MRLFAKSAGEPECGGLYYCHKKEKYHAQKKAHIQHHITLWTHFKLFPSFESD